MGRWLWGKADVRVYKELRLRDLLPWKPVTVSKTLRCPCLSFPICRTGAGNSTCDGALTDVARSVWLASESPAQVSQRCWKHGGGASSPPSTSPERGALCSHLCWVLERHPR